MSRRWEVFAVFDRASYLGGGDDLVRVLVDHRAPRGPLHLRTRALPPLAVGQVVRIDGGSLEFPRGRIAVEPAWVGPQPDQSRRPALDLADLAARVGGRGPGLTPAGDDVLAGALFARWGACDVTQRRELLAIARSVATNRIASAFLQQAAQGRCIEPAHDLLVALLSRDAPAADRARAELSSYGATSGAALALGIAGELADAHVDELCSSTPGIGPGGRMVAEEVQ